MSTLSNTSVPTPEAKAAHSPAPWQVSSLNDRYIGYTRMLPMATVAGVVMTPQFCAVAIVHFRGPEETAANAALIALVAAELGVPKSAVAISSGEKSRRKAVHVTGITAGAATARLERRAG